MRSVALAIFLAGIPALAWSSPDAVKSVPLLPAGQVTLLEGQLVVTQHSGDELLDESSYQARLLVMSHGRVSDSRRIRATTVRTLESDTERMVSLDRLLLNADLGVSEIADAEQETEDPYSELNLYFPRRFLPTFPIPRAGESQEGEAELTILNQYFASGRFKQSSKLEGAKLQIQRVLAADSRPAFEFLSRGGKHPSRVAEYKEVYVVDRERGILSGIERRMKCVVVLNGEEITLSSSLELRASTTWPKNDEQKKQLEEASKALEEIRTAFRARKPSQEIAPKIEALAKLTAPTPLKLLDQALRTHLKGYVDTFESTFEYGVGPVFARILGKKLPDVTVEDFDGKKVKLREVIKDKVALLNFWGLG